MLRASDYADGDAVYTYVANDGSNVHIDAERLRHWCEAMVLAGTLRPQWTPIEPRIAKKFFVENCVSAERIKELARGRIKLTPIIYCKAVGSADGHPDVLLVDGHHRYCLWAMIGAPAAQAYVLEQSQWEPFKIEGLPDLTAQELRSMPLTRREY